MQSISDQLQTIAHTHDSTDFSLDINNYSDLTKSNIKKFITRLSLFIILVLTQTTKQSHRSNKSKNLKNENKYAAVC